MSPGLWDSYQNALYPLKEEKCSKRLSYIPSECPDNAFELNTVLIAHTTHTFALSMLNSNMSLRISYSKHSVGPHVQSPGQIQQWSFEKRILPPEISGCPHPGLCPHMDALNKARNNSHPVHSSSYSHRYRLRKAVHQHLQVLDLRSGLAQQKPLLQRWRRRWWRVAYWTRSKGMTVVWV